MASDVQVVGAEQLQSALGRWADHLPNDLAEGTRSFAGQLRQTLADRVPYLTGTLANSAAIIQGPALGDPGAVFALGLGQDVPYAGWIEFGGSRGRPRVPEGRYVYPTAEEAVPAFVDAVTQATQASIDHYPWPTPA